MKWSPEFTALRESRYNIPPSDALWNPMGFKNDYLDVQFSEMSAHSPILEYFASRADSIVEFGTRHCHSTIAFLAGAKDKVISFDIQPTPSIIYLLEMRDKGLLPCKWNFVCHSTTDPNYQIEECDILFIDTIHNFFQVQQELKLHANKARKWLIFHDYFTQRSLSLDSTGQIGIGPAIDQFLENNKNWKPIYSVNFNHGLLILERTNSENCLDCGRDLNPDMKYD